ncbi:Golgin subfamily A member 5 [Araneus ventricosus]|uniref:Golgin subfamily A member 5 n=1 Tax=Araneus ventricosus TaxID=182803 RepID=A0A4Y2VE17_ARAVE|nr:Golgin subfamily A member 5 [Araneus ventricosus]
MSWFSEIAGKAEDLLNRVDQSAAEALQNSAKSRSRSRLDEIPSESNYSPSRVYSNPLRPSTSSNAASPSTLERKLSYSQGTLTPKRKSVSDDEKLFEFLNASDKLPTPSRKERPKTSTSPEKKHFPPINSQSQNVAFVQKIDANDSSIPKTETTVDVHDANSPQIAFEQQQNGEIVEKASDSAPVSQSAPEAADVSIAKALTVNQDVLQVENLSKNAETETKKLQKKAEPWNSQMFSSEKMIRELREREKDMTAATEAKDSQLAILKVRLQEADQELQIKRNLVKELEVENDRMIKEHAQSAAFQNKTVEVLREQLQQAEAELNKTKEAMLQNQNDHMQKVAKMEEEHRHLVDSYSSLQKKWNELNGNLHHHI